MVGKKWRGIKGTRHPLWTWNKPGVRVSSVAVLTAGGNPDGSLHSVKIMMKMMLENDPQTQTGNVKL